MKLKTLLACILLSGTATAQWYDKPGKKCNTILINTTDSVHLALKKLKHLMIVNGYTIEVEDFEYHLLQTKHKTIKCGFTLTHNIRAIFTSDSLTHIQITGNFINHMELNWGGVVTTPAEVQTENIGMNKSAYNCSWTAMYEFAQQYSGGKFYYNGTKPKK